MRRHFPLIGAGLWLGLFLGLPAAVAQDKPDAGEVVAAPGMDCSDYFAVKTGDDYALLEWYSGAKPEKGDKVSGDFTHFGIQEIADSGAVIHAYVEDYGLDLDDANDKLKEKCQ